MKPYPAGGDGRPLFLFSVDVEEPGAGAGDGVAARSRVPELTGRYLDFLRRHEALGTFFIVGNVARALPDLVRRILDEGHEVGCHSDAHVPFDRLGPEGFRADTGRALAALAAAGAKDVRGYRAPCFSLTGRTFWAHESLAGLGFAYSSSVLPARSPLYGWPGFGGARTMAGGLVELPVTLFSPRAVPVPSGGVYWRALPAWLVRRRLAAHRRRGGPVLSYFHPYDVDETPERAAHPGFARFGLSNWLLHRNRGEVFPRLESAAALGFRFAPYGPYAHAMAAALAAEPARG